ncbi:hypothetical protein TWF192_007087 [Orbilia oligospora]|uniref:Secreted protein n=1 Tax=Orbilia oligospora TaxID=2813651 RepID=A0A6G1MNC8_ORBOL|nr:hypothetical protein TWF191_000264 [Orbilia oligospora]KAF3262413.1 hypothetical protein TWF192_007087 [Orbilia oligospora]
MLRKVVVVTASLGAITSAAAAPVAGPEPAPVTQPKAVAGHRRNRTAETHPAKEAVEDVAEDVAAEDVAAEGNLAGDHSVIAPQACMGRQKHTHPRPTILNHHLTAPDREVTDLGLVPDPQAGTNNIKRKTISPGYA